MQDCCEKRFHSSFAVFFCFYIFWQKITTQLNHPIKPPNMIATRCLTLLSSLRWFVMACRALHTMWHIVSAESVGFSLCSHASVCMLFASVFLILKMVGKQFCSSSKNMSTLRLNNKNFSVCLHINVPLIRRCIS